MDDTPAPNVHLLDETLFINSWTEDDNGDYKCEVTNQAGTTQSNSVKLSAAGRNTNRNYSTQLCINRSQLNVYSGLSYFSLFIFDDVSAAPQCASNVTQMITLHEGQDLLLECQMSWRLSSDIAFSWIITATDIMGNYTPVQVATNYIQHRGNASTLRLPSKR